MSSARRQALVPSPVEAVWELVGDPRRHPDWWPRVEKVDGTRFYAGDSYAQVTKRPIGRVETTLVVEELEDLREIGLRCLRTGMYSRWLLTPAQDGTFLDVEFGIEPDGATARLLDAAAGRRYFTRWVDESIEALTRAVVESAI